MKYVHLVISGDEGIQVINNLRTYMLHALILDLVNNSDKVVIISSQEKLEKGEILKISGVNA